MIAIHYQKGNYYCLRWKQYCDENDIVYKLVNCYENNILEQLEDCKALLWHIDNYNYKDQLFAKLLIKSLDNRKIKVFPDHNTAWHFDDKVAQKYLFESIGAPLVATYVFYDKKSALKWVDKTSFPKVFKLRKGSGSKNVQLIKTSRQARKLINKAFNRGFPVFDMQSILKERYRKYKLGKESFLGLLKGVARIFIGTTFIKMASREKGYIYFQEFRPNNTFDQRVIVIGKRAIAHKRMVRKNDFRASGSGIANFKKDEIDLRCIKIAIDTNRKLKLQSTAYDFIYDQENNPEIVEISYAFNPIPNQNSHEGYWDENLIWQNEKVKFPEDWMLEDLLKKIR